MTHIVDKIEAWVNQSDENDLPIVIKDSDTAFTDVKSWLAEIDARIAEEKKGR